MTNTDNKPPLTGASASSVWCIRFFAKRADGLTSGETEVILAYVAHELRENKMKIKYALSAIAVSTMLSSCTDADIASHNLSKAADQFEIERRVVFYNGITGDYMLTVEGRCSLGNNDKSRELTITCKTGPSEYKKHFLGLSDNVTYFVEQMEAKNVSAYHYRVVFKPQTIIPDVEFRGDLGELAK